MLGVESFPELAAMEAEFQASLARGMQQFHTQHAKPCDFDCHHYVSSSVLLPGPDNVNIELLTCTTHGLD